MTRLGLMTIVMLLFGFSSEARARLIDEFTSPNDHLERREQKPAESSRAPASDKEEDASKTKECAETLTKK